MTTLERSKTIRSYADYVAFLNSLSPALRNIWAEVLPVPADNLCNESAACPCCGNRDMDWLLWQDDDSLTCAKCKVNYEPR